MTTPKKPAAQPSSTPPKNRTPKQIVFTLPFPPTVNTYWRVKVVGRGRKAFPQFYISEKGQLYRENVIAAIVDRFGWPKALTCNVKVILLLTMPDNRVRDLDNYPKGILDSLTHANVWKDDSQVKKLWIEHEGVGSPGEVQVTIEEIIDRDSLF